MGNLRARIERDLARTIEGDFGLPVVLVSPDGEIQDHSANDPTSLLFGRIDYDRTELDPETGMPVQIKKPMVTLRVSSLTRIPQAGENWAVKIPVVPSATAPMVTFFLEQAPRDGGSYAYIKLPLTNLSQSS